MNTDNFCAPETGKFLLSGVGKCFFNFHRTFLLTALKPRDSADFETKQFNHQNNFRLYIMAKETSLTGNELFFDENEIIVSKTDLKGKLTYCNDVFLRIAGYTEQECLGQPHNMIRHPEMPRCIFELLWETLQGGDEIFAYVVNRCKNGDHYWVNAHVTPSRKGSGEIIGYHSNRRVPDRKILEDRIIPLYKDLLKEEQRHDNRKAGMAASKGMIHNLLGESNVEYDEFVARL